MTAVERRRRDDERLTPPGTCYACGYTHSDSHPAYAAVAPVTRRQAAMLAVFDLLETAGIPMSSAEWVPAHADLLDDATDYLTHWARTVRLVVDARTLRSGP